MLPFGTGSHFLDWQMFNCDHCKKFDLDPEKSNCEIDEALAKGHITGDVSQKICQRMGFSEKSGYIWRCNEFDDKEE